MKKAPIGKVGAFFLLPKDYFLTTKQSFDHFNHYGLSKCRNNTYQLVKISA